MSSADDRQLLQILRASGSNFVRPAFMEAKLLPISGAAKSQKQRVCG
ncbi:hypothetical protein BRYFOR_05167 [Marvinbryantia formatexigens DSM 14469]|uniref:Uncharacterized protein n=1 Tax=Marvinbryantia formatexigens DSM 14469 TaxID=478749 RepID=C6L977_9FIRM|nr:hypothetical protein BRYFOR_05167 [Marvinbryantia formatexigens DSM 14469]